MIYVLAYDYDYEGYEAPFAAFHVKPNVIQIMKAVPSLSEAKAQKLIDHGSVDSGRFSSIELIEVPTF